MTTNTIKPQPKKNAISVKVAIDIKGGTGYVIPITYTSVDAVIPTILAQVKESPVEWGGIKVIGPGLASYVVRMLIKDCIKKALDTEKGNNA